MGAWLAATSWTLRVIVPHIGRGKRSGYHFGPIAVSPSAVVNDCKRCTAAAIDVEFEVSGRG